MSFRATFLLPFKFPFKENCRVFVVPVQSTTTLKRTHTNKHTHTRAHTHTLSEKLKARDFLIWDHKFIVDR